MNLETRIKAMDIAAHALPHGTVDDLKRHADIILSWLTPPPEQMEEISDVETTELAMLAAAKVYAIQHGRNIDAMLSEEQERTKWLAKQVVGAYLKAKR